MSEEVGGERLTRSRIIFPNDRSRKRVFHGPEDAAQSRLPLASTSWRGVKLWWPSLTKGLPVWDALLLHFYIAAEHESL